MNPWPYQVQAVSREPRHTRSPLEANAILPLNEKGIIACIAPGAALDVSRSKADSVRPPLRTRGAVRQHRTQHTLDMSERHLDLTGIFPPQIDRKSVLSGKSVSARVVLVGRRIIKKQN